jgi:alkylation response protein AidB-like acyl-CoA dehydrogenase
MIPDYQTLMLPVLKSCAQGEVVTRDVIDKLADDFNLTSEEREELLPSGKQARFDNRVHWAKGYLKQAGLVTFTARSHFVISEVGQRVLSENPTKIDNKFLDQFDAFQDFKNRKGTQSGNVGERSFALHYSEPEAGSDLASLRTKATRDGDDWIINGQKLWSTGGDKAEWSWLAVRTDPDAKPRHAGISVFLMPLETPGITIRPSFAMYGKTFSATFYDDVRVPARNMVGAVNEGWKVIISALAAERVMIGTLVAMLQRVFNQVTEHVISAEVGGKALKDDPVVRDRIGGLAAEIEVARQFVLRNSRLVEEGSPLLYEAAMSKIFAGELQESLSEAALDIIGSGALLSEDAPSAPVGQLEQVLRHSLMGVIGGGTGEMQRNAIAIRGLKMPRG